MNCVQWLSDVDLKGLDKKKPQTEYKIQYMKEYVKLWLFVSENRENIKNINFIDCMCNAGIYGDGDLCTAMEVLKLYVCDAKYHRNITFHLYLNDHDENRIENTKKIVDKILEGNNQKNICIHYNTDDVNTYICDYNLFDPSLKFDASTILFVDPYSFGVVKLNLLRDFIRKYYCEVSFNVFTSDFVRNGPDDRIKDCLGTNKKFVSTDEIVDYVTSKLKVGKMQYAFPYRFKTSNNVELYQILFLTPNIRGLEKLKEALRTVFKGMEYYRNPPKNQQQLSLFSAEDKEDVILDNCAVEAREKVLTNFSGKTVSYSELEAFIIEKTILQKSNIIDYILTPLIEDKKIEKCNKTERKNNYTKDDYTFLC